MGGTLFERLHVPSPGNTRESGQDSNDFIGKSEGSSTLGTPTMPSMNAPPGARRSRRGPWYRREPHHGNPCDEDQGYEDRGYRLTSGHEPDITNNHDTDVPEESKSPKRRKKVVKQQKKRRVTNEQQKRASSCCDDTDFTLINES